MQNLRACPLLWPYSKHRLFWLQAELKDQLAAKTAAISLLETTVTSLESDLRERTEEWQGAFERLEELSKMRTLAWRTSWQLSLLRR